MGRSHRQSGLAIAWLLLAIAPGVGAATLLENATQDLAEGRYEQAAAAARRRLAQRPRDVEGLLILLRASWATGRIAEARAAALELETSADGSLYALRAAAEVWRQTGDSEREKAASARLARLVEGGADADADPRDRVAAGQIALARGADPKQILAEHFEAAVRARPDLREGYLAAGELALAKHDDALAASWLRRGLRKLGPDADLHAALARAFLDGDRKEMQVSLAAALQRNPRHIPALLLQTEHEIDGNDLAAAGRTLDRVFAIDAEHPLGWAFAAVIAHLGNDPAGEAQARRRALGRWARNPEIDSLVGRKLSANYRFREGAAYQKRALALVPGFLPAKLRLAQDLLRLGDEVQGWALAGEVRARDGYDVEAHNLGELKNHLAAMKTIESGGFRLRMDARDALIWADDALTLLREARATLDQRYGFVPARTTTVEVFADQADFAVRTFGMPGGGGYLGVCFGDLITANSPAGSSGVVFNWQAVLWHEYTHVITLGLARNKLPRWLAEGISVWEETRRNPTWGQGLSPRYRDKILHGELIPLGKLSGAFLAPKNGEDVMFAYFESALAVEFLVQRGGFPALRQVLVDIGAGIDAARAIERRVAPLALLEPAFELFARQKAHRVAPDADPARPDAQIVAADDPKILDRWLKAHPRSLWGLETRAAIATQAGELDAARAALEKFVALYPGDRRSGGAYFQLAQLHRRQGQAAAERAALDRLASIAADALPAYERLLELAEARGDRDAAARAAGLALAVNPRGVPARRAAARAAETKAQQDPAAIPHAVASYRKFLASEPPDPADAHYRLSRLLAPSDPQAARRHIIEALVEAPRFRPAYELLRELQRRAK